jgi:hypothetical protein
MQRYLLIISNVCCFCLMWIKSGTPFAAEH